MARSDVRGRAMARSDVRARAMTRSAARIVMTGGVTPTEPYRLIKDRLDIEDAKDLFSNFSTPKAKHTYTYNVLFKLVKIPFLSSPNFS